MNKPNNLSTLTSLYLEAHALSWAPSTLKSERHRLAAVENVLDGTPEPLWAAIEHLAPYTRLTVWTRVCDFWQWCLDRGHVTGSNQYRVWREEHKRLFKNAYETRTPDMSWEEAKRRIQTITNSAAREKALVLLEGGLRWAESHTVDNGQVVGKGEKRRDVFVTSGGPAIEYRTFLRALAKVGLKPHTLRKLFATQCSRAGMNEADLCETMGWSSFLTAKSYIASRNKEERAAMVRSQVHGGTTKHDDTNDDDGHQ